MLGSRSKYIRRVKKRWDERAKRYDKWYKTFKGAIEHYVDWELLRGYLPKQRTTKILDAAGGTGRITIILARMGYSVTLCDISRGMLNEARRKLIKAGIIERVKILECNVNKLPFSDESFDFVLCWDGMFEAAKELIRVIKKKGKVSIFLMNKCGAAISQFRENPDSALTLLKSESAYIHHDEEKHKALSPEEAKEYFEKEGVKVFEIYAVCGMLDFLSIPEEVLKSIEWDEKFFKQTTEILLRLSKEPSVKGLSRHLVLYGEKI